ncbi:MAG: DMT family transporter, partial [Pseudoflavonifractor sp.]
ISGAFMGTLLFAAYSVQTLGLAETTPGKNAFLTAVYCVIVPFLYWIVSKRGPDRYNVAAALLCITGVGLVSLNADFSITRGDALTLLGGIIYACHIVTVSRMSQEKDVFLLTTVQFAVTAGLSWIFALIFEDFPAAVSPQSVGWLVFLAVAATAGALLFQNVGQKYTPPATAAVLLSLEAPFGIMFSVAAGSEKLTAQMCVGFAFIFVSILCSETKFSFLRKNRGATPTDSACPKNKA